MRRRIKPEMERATTDIYRSTHSIARVAIERSSPLPAGNSSRSQDTILEEAAHRGLGNKKEAAPPSSVQRLSHFVPNSLEYLGSLPARRHSVGRKRHVFAGVAEFSVYP